MFLNVWDSSWDNVQTSNHADSSTTPTTPTSSSIGVYDVHIPSHDNHNDDITINTIDDVGIKGGFGKDEPLTLPNDNISVLDEANNNLKTVTSLEPTIQEDVDSDNHENQEIRQENTLIEHSKNLDQVSLIHSNCNNEDTNQQQTGGDSDSSVVDAKVASITEHVNSIKDSIPSVAPGISDSKDSDDNEGSIDSNGPITDASDNDAGMNADSGSDTDNDDFGDFETESQPLEVPAKPKGLQYNVPITTLLASIIPPSTPNNSITTTNTSTFKYDIENTPIESILNINHARKYKNLLTRPTRQFLHVDDLPNSTIVHLTRRRGHRQTMSMSSAGTFIDRTPAQSNIEIEVRKILLDLRRSEKPKFNFSWRQTQHLSLSTGLSDRSSCSLPNSPVDTPVGTMFESRLGADSNGSKASARSSMIALPTKSNNVGAFTVSQTTSIKKPKSPPLSIASPISKSSTGDSFTVASESKSKPLTINTAQVATVNAAIAASIVGTVHKNPNSGSKGSLSSSDRKDSIGSLSSTTTNFGALSSSINNSNDNGLHPVTSTVKSKLSIMEPLTPTCPVLPSASTMTRVVKSTLHDTPVVLNPTFAVSDSPPVSSMPFGSTTASLAESTPSSADDDDDDNDDWGDFVSDASPPPDPGPDVKSTLIGPGAPVIPASATFAPPLAMSLGPVQPTIKSKAMLETEKVAAIVDALPDLSFMLEK